MAKPTGNKSEYVFDDVYLVRLEGIMLVSLAANPDALPDAKYRVGIEYDGREGNLSLLYRNARSAKEMFELIKDGLGL
jgi:hypothetical protein